MKTLFTLLFCISVSAQEPVPQLDPNWRTQLIEDFQKDPRFEVKQNSQGDTLIKARTDRSKNPDDPDERDKLRNSQMMWNVFGGFHFSNFKSGQILGAYSDFKTVYEENPGSFSLQHAIGFRPPFRFLKRLMIGGYGGPAFGDGGGVPEFDRNALVNGEKPIVIDRDFIHGVWFEVDAILIPHKSIEHVLSVGAFSERQGISGVQGAEPYHHYVDRHVTDSGVLLRYKFLTSAGSTGAWGPYVGFKYYKRSGSQITIGGNWSFGPLVAVKKRIEK